MMSRFEMRGSVQTMSKKNIWSGGSSKIRRVGDGHYKRPLGDNEQFTRCLGVGGSDP